MNTLDGDRPALARGEREIVLHTQCREHLISLWHQNDASLSELVRHAAIDALAAQSDRAVGDCHVLRRQEA